MQSLLQDPVFYNLLINNNESLNKKPQNFSNSENAVPTTSTSIPTPSTTPNTTPPTTEAEINKKEIIDSLKSNDWDFNFLKKLSFPNFSEIPALNHLNETSTVTSQSESTYQSSIFSSNDESKNQSHHQIVLDDSYVESIDEFFNKEMSLQINSDISSNVQPEPEIDGQLLLNLPQLPKLELPSKLQHLHQQAQQKQFHKFYTNQKAIPSRVTKPSIPSSTKFSLQAEQQLISPSCDSSAPLLAYHKCPFCQRQFKNKSYLSRHLKKHDEVKDFKCPFFNEQHSKCHHLNGEFSRKDTYKAHLKSIHFIYPVGVFKNDRNLSIGRCAGCFKEFQNNNDWLNNHIELEECSGLAKYKQSQEQKSL